MNNKSEVSPELLDILVCPVCHGELKLKKDADVHTGLVCANCRLIYPVCDGIPQMLPDQAVSMD